MAGNQDWAARASGTTGILFVCHGNICRSTMAQFVMEELVRRAGRAGSFEIDSAATSREELGNDVHPGTREPGEGFVVTFAFSTNKFQYFE